MPQEGGAESGGNLHFWDPETQGLPKTRTEKGQQEIPLYLSPRLGSAKCPVRSEYQVKAAFLWWRGKSTEKNPLEGPSS